MVAVRAVAVPTPAELAQARAVVQRHLVPTPLVATAALGRAADVQLKLETLQPTGSFKVRGALAALSGGRDGRVVTASAGNHGLAVAWAARRLGVDARIVVPEAVLAGRVTPRPGETTVVVVSGRNLTAQRLREVLA